MTVRQDPHNLEEIQLHELANPVNKDVLEIGCGEGRLIRHYHEVVQHIVGIDMELEALHSAKNSLPDQGEFALADAIHLPFEANSFDIVIYAWSL